MVDMFSKVNSTNRIVAIASYGLLVIATQNLHAFYQDPSTSSDRQQPSESVPKGTFVGDWIGSVGMGKNKLSMSLHLRQSEDGRWRGSIDSPEQGALGIPIDSTKVEGKKILCEIKSAGASIEATLSNDAQAIEGVWIQGGEHLFQLKRSDTPRVSLRRPQTPKAPYPYRSEEVVFENPWAKIQLAGTLTLPAGTGPHPAIVLISGSGPQNRDEEIEEHRIFFVIADYLARKGVAVLRYDDRGVGESTGEFSGASTMDFADDAIAAVEYLCRRTDILHERVGLLGHSEGGIVASIAEVKSGKVAFMVLMASPGVNGEQILYEQSRHIIASNGGSEKVIEENRLVQEDLFHIVIEESDRSIAASKLKELTEAKASQRKALGWTSDKMDAWRADFESECNRVNTPWFRMFLTLDPAEWLKRVKAPVLAINGELDTQVVADQNLPAIEKALTQGGHSRYIMKRLPRLNHQLQTCKTGSPKEYREIEETIAPLALEIIGEWVSSTISTK